MVYIKFWRKNKKMNDSTFKNTGNSYMSFTGWWHADREVNSLNKTFKIVKSFLSYSSPLRKHVRVYREILLQKPSRFHAVVLSVTSVY